MHYVALQLCLQAFVFQPLKTNLVPSCQVLHCGRQLPVTITLANIISKSFGEEYQERKMEEEQEAQAAAAASGGLQEGLGADGTISIPLFGELI